MNLMQAKHAFESAPWVRRAVVRRVWPNRLSVTLEEHRPIAYWDEADRTAEQLIDNFGDVFEVNMADVEEQTLPQLSGPPDAASQMLSMMQRLNERFAHLPAQIDRLELNERGSWRAILDTEAQIELGRGTEPEVLPRVEAFVSTLPQVTTRYRAALLSADLRHRDGYAVRLKDVYTGENALRDKSRGKSHPSY